MYRLALFAVVIAAAVLACQQAGAPARGADAPASRPEGRLTTGVIGWRVPPPGTMPAKVEWDASLFNYDRPKTLVVEEATPTIAQLGLMTRPPQEPADAPEPKATGPAKPQVLGTLNVIHLRFRDATGDIVPAMLCTPRDKKGPFPLVVAVHGMTSNKGQVCAQVAPALAAKGFAVLAADLPGHGERATQPAVGLDPDALFKFHRKAATGVRQLIDLAEARPDLDLKPGVALAGYSLGSWVCSVAGPVDSRVKAMVLMVGGAVDAPRAALSFPKVAAMDPRLSMEHFAGRPVLLLNGRTDEIVTPESAKRLFDAALEPKKQIWYDYGHRLPAGAYTDAADWLAGAMLKKPASQPATRASGK